MEHRFKKLTLTVFIFLFLFATDCLAASLITVNGSAMFPTIKAGQKVWIISYHKSSPKRQDIVAFKIKGLLMVKRVIGLPGDTVNIKQGAVYIYNQWNPKGYRLDEPYLAPGARTPEAKYRVPAGHYFVLGDNRQHSRDSINFGPIPRSAIIGKVRNALFLPLDKKKPRK